MRCCWRWPARSCRSHQSTVKGSWKPFFGRELRDKTLGIVGLGRIGKAVCERAAGFGMRLVAFDPYPDHKFASAHNINVSGAARLAGDSDVVSLHAQQTGQRDTHRRGRIELMKPSALLINTARGQLVDEDAMAAALREGG